MLVYLVLILYLIIPLILLLYTISKKNVTLHYKIVFDDTS